MSDYKAFTVACYRCAKVDNFDSWYGLQAAVGMGQYLTVDGVGGVICLECYECLAPMQKEMQAECRAKVKEEIEAYREAHKPTMRVIN